MKSCLLGAVCASLFTLITAASDAATISDLYNTGVDDGGFVMPLGELDIHYSMTGPLSSAKVITKNDLWIEPPDGSAWIGPTNGNITDPSGTYTYVISFDMSALIPNTASIFGRWASDDAAKIILNGIDTGITNDTSPFQVLHDFTISNGFIAGVNHLSFEVNNIVRPIGNPTGLLVAELSGEASPVPIPSAFWLMVSSVASIVGFRKWKMK